jgi:cobalt-zinc-cadmium efflux system outer membrane protein
MNIRHGAIIFAAVLLMSCAHYQARPLAPEKTAAQLESRRLDDPGLKTFLEQNAGHKLTIWPNTNWDLPELTLAAFYFDPSLAAARDQWLVARAGLKTAGARPNPSVSIAPGYDTQIPGNYSPWLVPLSFDVPIEMAGKRGKRMAEAEKAVESARWNFVSAAWQIRRAVRASLLDYTIAGRRAGLLQQEFNFQMEIVKMLQQRLDAGEISRPEVTIVQIAVSKTQLDLSDARLKQAEALSQLAEALGLGQSALEREKLNFNFSTRNLKELTSAEARNVALRSRADILAALADYATAEADLRLEIAKQYPDLHLGPGYAWNNGNAGDNEWILGLALELPVLDQNQGPIAAARARRKLAGAKFVALQAQVMGEIDRAVADFRVAREQLQTGAGLFQAEQRQQKSAEEQLHAGADDRLDVLDAQLELSNAQLAQLDDEAKLQMALGALEDALQRPGDSIAAVIAKISGAGSSNWTK